jgi:hypothetical protein
MHYVRKSNNAVCSSTESNRERFSWCNHFIVSPPPDPTPIIVTRYDNHFIVSPLPDLTPLVVKRFEHC